MSFPAGVAARLCMQQHKVQQRTPCWAQPLCAALQACRLQGQCCSCIASPAGGSQPASCRVAKATTRARIAAPVVVFVRFYQLVLEQLVDRLQHNLVPQAGIQLCLSQARLELHPTHTTSKDGNVSQACDCRRQPAGQPAALGRAPPRAHVAPSSREVAGCWCCLPGLLAGCVCLAAAAASPIVLRVGPDACEQEGAPDPSNGLRHVLDCPQHDLGIQVLWQG